VGEQKEDSFMSFQLEIPLPGSRHEQRNSYFWNLPDFSNVLYAIYIIKKNALKDLRHLLFLHFDEVTLLLHHKKSFVELFSLEEFLFSALVHETTHLGF